MAQVFENFAEAYMAVISDVMSTGLTCRPVEDKTSVGSHFGKKLRETREILAHKFIVKDPRSRTVISQVRHISDVFCRANFIWTLTGGGNVEEISFYNAKGRLFAKDSAFYEAAFGARLFYPFQQFRHVENRLKRDSSSRRGLATIYIPEDTQADKLDTPCAAYLHFMIRQDMLHCICNMRSQSALMVLPYDFYLFSMIQECMAVRLQVELGEMIYTSNSLHIYNDEYSSAEALLSSNCVAPDRDLQMLSASDKMLASLIGAEQKIRLGDARPSTSLDDYWSDFLKPIRKYCKPSKFAI